MTEQKPYKEIQLTHDAKGHCLNSTQCFSPDGTMIVYDTRNVDSALASNGEIRVIDLNTGEDTLVYKTKKQTAFGPGVGAVTFSPVANRVMFLAGILNADESQPYSITRRTGFAVDVAGNGNATRLDARDIVSPYTPGALRGGTHAHTWSGDGEWISFTYNDHVLHEAATSSDSIIDTRTVGLMFPRQTMVDGADDIENINGTMFSVVVTDVVKKPHPGSDEISRAFDECWIGKDGYLLPDGSRQKRAIAFQGEILDQEGNKKTEIFVADIPADLGKRAPGDFFPGTATTLPAVPHGVKQRRISFTEKGVSAAPRHWLRSSPDGSMIGYLSSDSQGLIQFWTISPNGGEPVQRTFLDVSISGPFNFNSSGTAVAFVADGSVFVTRLSDARSERITVSDSTKGKLVGAVNWSPTESKVCYNRYVKTGEQEYMQIFISDVTRAL